MLSQISNHNTEAQFDLLCFPSLEDVTSMGLDIMHVLPTNELERGSPPQQILFYESDIELPPFASSNKYSNINFCFDSSKFKSPNPSSGKVYHKEYENSSKLMSSRTKDTPSNNPRNLGNRSLSTPDLSQLRNNQTGIWIPEKV